MKRISIVIYVFISLFCCGIMMGIQNPSNIVQDGNSTDGVFREEPGECLLTKTETEQLENTNLYAGLKSLIRKLFKKHKTNGTSDRENFLKHLLKKIDKMDDRRKIRIVKRIISALAEDSDYKNIERVESLLLDIELKREAWLSIHYSFKRNLFNSSKQAECIPLQKILYKLSLKHPDVPELMFYRQNGFKNLASIIKNRDANTNTRLKCINLITDSDYPGTDRLLREISDDDSPLSVAVPWAEGGKFIYTIGEIAKKKLRDREKMKSFPIKMNDFILNKF